MKKRLFVGLFAVVILALFLAACSSNSGNNAEKQGDEAGEVAKPSNGGGPGEAVNLKGNPVKGQEVFAANCVPCHGEQGKGDVPNPGSADGTVPSLNPIDSTMVSSDPKTFATNIDLFLEHGSTPGADKQGSTPEKSMPAFGDQKTLTPQQIADVIAYVMSLNKK